MADISKITLPSGDSYNIKDGSAIASISRSGTTFTATKRDGSTATFSQQDSDTTYTAASAVTAIATAAVTGTSTAYARADHVHDITSATITSALGYTPPTAQDITDAFRTNDAMLFKGTIGTDGTVETLPTTHYQGWTYKVITAGTYAGQVCEIGDMIICTTDGTVIDDGHWTVVQTNTDGMVTGPSSSVADHVITFNGTSGKIIKDSGYTIAKSVPSDALFTDHTYTAASAAPAVIASSTASVTGTSTDYARQDHTHGLTSEAVTAALGFAPSSNPGVTNVSTAAVPTVTVTATSTASTVTETSPFKLKLDFSTISSGNLVTAISTSL